MWVDIYIAETESPELRVVKRTTNTHTHTQQKVIHSPTHAFKFTELINEKKSEKMLNA